MKKSVFLVFLIGYTINFVGQSNERLWEIGALTWNDFKGNPTVSSANDSELNYQLHYATTRKKSGNTVFNLFEVKNYVNPDISWVKTNRKSNQLLKYNQVVFNILEVHRRKLQKELHQIDNPYLAEGKFQIHYQNYNRTVKEFQTATKFGKDEAQLNYWDQKISNELQESPLRVIPEIIDKDFGYGLNIGLGTGFFTESLSDFSKSTFGMTFGFDFAYKNTLLFLNGTLAFSKVKNDYVEDGLLWEKDLKTNVAIIDVSIGQAIIDTKKHKLTPFAGLGILEFTARDSEKFEDHRIVNYGFIYGINYDFKFRNKVNLTSQTNLLSFRERLENNIRVRLYATSANYENMQGTSINLSIGYALFARKVKLK